MLKQLAVVEDLLWALILILTKLAVVFIPPL